MAGRSLAAEEPPPFWCRCLFADRRARCEEPGAEEERGGGGSPGPAKSLRLLTLFFFYSPLLFSGGGLFAEEMDGGARPGGAPGQSREYKLVMLGAGGVGKSGG